MRINVSGLPDYPANSFLDAGRYTVMLQEIRVEQTRSGGEQLVIGLTVTDGPAQKSGMSPIGHRLFHRLVLPSPTHKDQGMLAGSRIRTFCDAFGIPYDATGFDDQDAIGRSAIAIVGIGKSDSGAEFEEVKRFLPL